MRRTIRTGVLLACLTLIACDTGLLGQSVPVEVIEQIETNALLVRLAEPPATTVTPEAVMAAARERVGLAPSRPVYAKVSCLNRPTLGCVEWNGFAGAPGEWRGVWIVTFADAAAKPDAPSTSWALLDEATLEVVLGVWP